MAGSLLGLLAWRGMMVRTAVLSGLSGLAWGLVAAGLGFDAPHGLGVSTVVGLLLGLPTPCWARAPVALRVLWSLASLYVGVGLYLLGYAWMGSSQVVSAASREEAAMKVMVMGWGYLTVSGGFVVGWGVAYANHWAVGSVSADF